jgi:hypothetical protein
MNCRNCGQPNSDSAKFCIACGRPMAAPVPTPVPIPIQSQPEPVAGKRQWIKRLPAIGSLIVILCFFFPWLMVSCSIDIFNLTEGKGLSFSAYQIASKDFPEMPFADTLQDLFDESGSDFFTMPTGYLTLLYIFPLMGMLGLFSLNGKLSGVIIAFFTGLLGIIMMLLFFIGGAQIGKEMDKIGLQLQFRFGFWGAWIGYFWQTVTAAVGMAKK